MRFLLAGYLLFSALGCAGYQSPAAKLADSVHRYNNAVRWRNYANASHYVPAPQRKAYLEKRDALTKDMKILDFEIKGVEHVKPNQVAEVQVKFTWHQLPSLMVKNTTFIQRWTYGDDKKWLYAGQKEIEATPTAPTKTSERF